MRSRLLPEERVAARLRLQGETYSGHCGDCMSEHGTATVCVTSCRACRFYCCTRHALTHRCYKQAHLGTLARPWPA